MVWMALEVLDQQHDVEQVRALLGHARLDTTQVYTTIRPPQCKARGRALRGKGGADARPGVTRSRGGFEKLANVSRTSEANTNKSNLVAPTGFGRLCKLDFRGVLP